jgi:hypothetical protein
MKRSHVITILFLLLAGCSPEAGRTSDGADPTSTPRPYIYSAEQIPTLRVPMPTWVPFTVEEQTIESVCLEFDYHNATYSREDNELVSLLMREQTDDLVIAFDGLLYTTNIDLVEEDCQGKLVVIIDYASQATSYGAGISQKTCHFGHEVQGTFQLIAGDDSLNYPFYDSLVWEGPYPEMILDKNCKRGTIDLDNFLITEFSKAMHTWYGPEILFRCAELPFTMIKEGAEVCKEGFENLDLETKLSVSDIVLEKDHFGTRVKMVEYLGLLWLRDPQTADKIIPVLLDVLRDDTDGEVRYTAGEILKKNIDMDFPGPIAWQWRLRANLDVDWIKFEIQDPQAWDEWWNTQE